MQYETDTTTRKGKITNFKTKNTQLKHNKYFLYGGFLPRKWLKNFIFRQTEVLR